MHPPRCASAGGSRVDIVPDAGHAVSLRTRDGPRVPIRTPALGATIETGVRSGRSRKWICPTTSPAATSRPRSRIFS